MPPGDAAFFPHVTAGLVIVDQNDKPAILQIVPDAVRQAITDSAECKSGEI